MGLFFSFAESKFITLERKRQLRWENLAWSAERHQRESYQAREAKGKELRDEETMREESLAGGWYEAGVWVDGSKDNKGEKRWRSLLVEWEGCGEDEDEAPGTIGQYWW